MTTATIEKLTDEERYQLRESQYDESRKALRIIDQLTAALDDMTKTASAGCARCLEREGDAHAKSEVTRLTAALEAAERGWEQDVKAAAEAIQKMKGSLPIGLRVANEDAG